MPEKLFFDLTEDKKNAIFEAGLKEFSEKSYQEASTNTIVKNAQISKGSLFKYFKTKEDLFFFILDKTIVDFTEAIHKKMSELKGDFFEAILRYMEIEFDWHMRNQSAFKLLKKSFYDQNAPVYEAIVKRYNYSSNTMYLEILSNFEVHSMKWENEKIMRLVKWTIEGYNSEFLKQTDDKMTLEDLKKMYIKGIHDYLEILKKGIYSS